MRNKEKTRKFLKMWADLEFLAPKGFSSSDNGAIHVALMKWFIGINKTRVKQCISIYNALEDPLEEPFKVSNLKPYWKFVNCARRTLGMGEWEGAYDVEKHGPIDAVLKQFRNERLELQSNGVAVKI